LSGLVGYYTTYRTVRETVDPVVAPRGNSAPTGDAGPLSIVVLPFVSRTTDPSASDVADGLTVSVTSDLSRIQDLFIADLATAVAAANKKLSTRDLGKDLGVRYVLEGSVQTAGSKIRIYAQLADTDSGRQIWSEAFDGDKGDLFALQDKITTLIGNSIDIHLTIRAANESERRARKPTIADLMLQARATSIHIEQKTSLEGIHLLEAKLREILAVDPQNVYALGRLADYLLIEYDNFATRLTPSVREGKLAEASRILTSATPIEPDNRDVLEARVWLAFLRGDIETGCKLGQRRVELTPKDWLAYNALAGCYRFKMEPERAITALKKAVDLNPKIPLNVVLTHLAEQSFTLGDYDAAIAWGETSVAANPEFGAGLWIAVGYAAKGQIEKAREAATDALRYNSDYSASGLASTQYAREPMHDWFIEKVAPMMRQAGFPA
jgi:TolB-like protein